MASSPQNPASGNGQPQQGFVGRVGHLNDSAHQLLDEARSTFEDLGQSVRGRVQRHPYAMVAAALGVGYVLGCSSARSPSGWWASGFGWPRSPW